MSGRLLVKKPGGKSYEFDFYTFTKKVLNYNKLGEMHKEWCKEATLSDKRKLFLKPRGTYKSTIYTVAYPIYKLLHNPNERILIVNATSENAEAFLREITSHFVRNERFISLFGHKIDPRAAKISSITFLNRTTYHKEPTISTIGVLGNLVSAHYSTIICDDLCNQQDRESPSIRERKKKWFQDLLSILDPGGELIVVGTRWHFKDLYNYIMEDLNPKLDAKDKYLIKIESCYQKDGVTPSFPDILGYKELERLKIEKGPLEFACTPEETMISMWDGSRKKIKDVVIGDELLGWIQHPFENSVIGVPTKVLNTFSKEGEVVTYVLRKRGLDLRCTRDHKWYNYKYDLYIPTHKNILLSAVRYRTTKYGNKRITFEDDWISSEKNSKIETVYALETETGNYVADGFASSNSQYINSPIPQESQIFFEDDFKTFKWLSYNKIQDNGQTINLDLIGYCDLALGKTKSSDFTCVATLGRDEKTGIVYLVDVFLDRVPPDKTLDVILRQHEAFNYKKFGVETNVFQSLFADNIKKASVDRHIYVPITEVNHRGSKELRIQSLQPFIKQGVLKVREDWNEIKQYKELMQQFLYFPMYGHDDGPDAVEGAFSLLKHRGFQGKPFSASTKHTPAVQGYQEFSIEQFKVGDMHDPSTDVMWQ